MLVPFSWCCPQTWFNPVWWTGVTLADKVRKCVYETERERRWGGSMATHLPGFSGNFTSCSSSTLSILQRAKLTLRQICYTENLVSFKCEVSVLLCWDLRTYFWYFKSKYWKCQYSLFSKNRLCASSLCSRAQLCFLLFPPTRYLQLPQCCSLRLRR
jgi:hypothetical protein